MGSNCNLAAFKFELNNSIPIIGTADSVVCLPDSVKFRNSVSNGNSFLWDFGDGTFSRTLNPTHFYSIPGKYIVKLVVQDTVLCYVKDSFYFPVRVVKFLPNVITPVNPICAKTPFVLHASGGKYYSWTPDQFLTNPNSPNPQVVLDTTTTFQVIITEECGVDTLTVKINILPVHTTLSNDTTICENQSVTLKASGGVSYSWSPVNSDINTFAGPSIICTPTQSRKYYVLINTLNGCSIKDSVTVTLHSKALKPIVSDSIICIQDSLAFTNLNTSSVKLNWNFGDGSTSHLFSPIHYYTNPGVYPFKVVFIDTVFCFVKDSLMMNVKVNKFNAGLISTPNLYVQIIHFN
jgi:hypothetical protein